MKQGVDIAVHACSEDQTGDEYADGEYHKRKKAG
jgi:hypothetical protein